jgi:hypothetical protein
MILNVSWSAARPWLFCRLHSIFPKSHAVLERMDRHELDAPEVLRFEQTAHDTVCFHIKKPFGFLTGAITRYQGENCCILKKYNSHMVDLLLTDFSIHSTKNQRRNT